MTYVGPLRDEPLAIELHNTIYGILGVAMDGLEEEASAEAWLGTLADRLPDGGSGAAPDAAALRQLRDPIRTALRETVSGNPVPGAALDAINRLSARTPRSPLILPGLGAGIDHHGATRADIILGAFARDAIALLTGLERGNLRACGAPGCVLMFLKDHPRREWCSNACGNRARQARHYERTRRHS
jgi:predicted RNA-binding Zn ribbon-like protein